MVAPTNRAGSGDHGAVRATGSLLRCASVAGRPVSDPASSGRSRYTVELTLPVLAGQGSLRAEWMVLARIASLDVKMVGSRRDLTA